MAVKPIQCFWRGGHGHAGVGMGEGVLAASQSINCSQRCCSGLCTVPLLRDVFVDSSSEDSGEDSSVNPQDLVASITVYGKREQAKMLLCQVSSQQKIN